MVGRSITAAAILLYLIVLGCVMLPGASPGASRKLSTDGNSETLSAARKSEPSRATRAPGVLPYRGASIQIQRVDWIDNYKKSIDEIAALGFDTVSFVVDTRLENGWCCHIYLDMRMTPTPEKLADLIGYAKGKGLRVILMPIVLLDNPIGNQWRGTISPNADAGGWDEFFTSYRAMLTHFAWIAEQNKVDVMSVGSELVSAESKLSHWTRLIHDIREVYHGQLTYSANWDHYTSIPFWDQLDLVGMNSYYKLGDDRHVKVEEIVSRWHDIQKDLLAFQQKVNKPILFLEIGWCSLANAADEPWDYTRTELEQDNDLQKRLYEGFFQSWYRKQGLGGFMVWEWTCGDGGNASAGPDGKNPTETEADQLRKGYTPENKPAEKVLREWLAKQW